MAGRIVRVSGPLVIAEGLADSKMYDLVFVGEQKLVGEIIEIRGARASIQVYEETAGIGPGDPVVSTNAPLSVELGPGLIGSIYDGIQRPLEVLREKSGSFLTRGLTANALDRQRRWLFQPLAKEGQAVKGGDIIGVVKETEIIEHKIMVPPQIEGTLVTIKKGEFTVADTIAEVKIASGETVPLTMMQRWPVRRSRPYEKKLPPAEPLVTGQRVVDTFFPLTKGGTACVPGPFGAGKCVSGSTLVWLANGRLVPIKEVFAENHGKGLVYEDKKEAYTILKKPLEIFSFVDGYFKKTKATTVYRGMSDELLRIRTATGRKIEVTPIHKLYKVDGQLNFKEVEAQHLSIGDFLVSPRWLGDIDNKNSFNLLESLSTQRVADELLLELVPQIINKATAKVGDRKTLAQKLGLSYDVLTELVLGRNRPTVATLVNLCKIAGEKVPRIKFIKGERQSKPVRIPKVNTKNFGIFLGLLLAGGTFKANSVKFFNNDEQLLALFEKVLGELFSLKAKRTVANTGKCSVVNSSVLAKILKSLGFPECKKSATAWVPQIILGGTKEVITGFLSAYFACDGYFQSGKGIVEIATSSEKMLNGLTYLLLRLGILVRTQERIQNGYKSYRLFFSGRIELERFYQNCCLDNVAKFQAIKAYLNLNKCSYTAFDIVPLNPQELNKIYTAAKRPYTCLKKAGVEIHNYLGKEQLSLTMFKKLSAVLTENDVSNKLKPNLFNHVFADKIIAIEKIPGPVEVYDLEVPHYHNFIGGNMPSILHNTVIQHQVAKWANAQIIVFIGCGERGNEMTDVLIEFPELTDPYSGRPLMERTVLIANTSNMPVAAREASIYTGIAIAEYFRDMGYDVALQADSTSRWAEALREISGRLEEMPGEEGYPAYLSSRLAAFYERAGAVAALGAPARTGSITAIGSVSPPGGDLSEPVVQATLRVTKVFWALEDRLAYERHFPAINWLVSYSLYLDTVEKWLTKEVAADFDRLRSEAMRLLQLEAELKEIVRLVGLEALSLEERVILETARSLREDFLQQNAFHEVDTFCSLKKQYLILRLIMTYHELALKACQAGRTPEDVSTVPVREKIARAKYIPEQKLAEIAKIEREIKEQLQTETEVGLHG